jgi:hypothetical protein
MPLSHAKRFRLTAAQRRALDLLAAVDPRGGLSDTILAADGITANILGTWCTPNWRPCDLKPFSSAAGLSRFAMVRITDVGRQAVAK